MRIEQKRSTIEGVEWADCCIYRQVLLDRGGPTMYQVYSAEYPLFLEKKSIYVVFIMYMKKEIKKETT